MTESVSAASSPLQPPRPLEGPTYSSESTPCFPSVTSAWVFASWGLLLALFSLAAFGMVWFTLLVCAALPDLGMDDLRQTKGSLRNYPVIGRGVGHGGWRLPLPPSNLIDTIIMVIVIVFLKGVHDH